MRNSNELQSLKALPKAVIFALLVMLVPVGQGLAQGPPTGPAGGDLSGTYPNPSLAIERVKKTGDTMSGSLTITIPALQSQALNLQRNHNQVGASISQQFTLTNSNDNPFLYAGVTGSIVNSTAGSEAGKLQFYTFGTGGFAERAVLNNLGQFGLGTASPNALLDLASTTQLSNRIRFSGQEYYQPANTSTHGIDIRLGANRTGERQLWFADSAHAINATNSQLRMRFSGSFASLDSISTDGTTTLPMGLNATGGNVGIGTVTPGYKLDVAGQVRSSGGFVFQDGTVQTTAATGSAITAVNGGLGLTGGGTSGALTLNIGAGTGLTAAADSVSVNYGATAGTAVQGNTAITVAAGTGMTGGGALTLGAGGTLTLTNSDRGSSQPIFKTIADAAGTTQFSAVSNSEALRFEGTGGTSISFDAATKKVTINGSGGSSGWTDGGTSVSLATSSDNVGVGTAAPSTKLHVAGGTRVDGTNGRVYLGTVAAAGARGLEFIEENATTFSIRHHDPAVAWRNIALNAQGGNVGIGNLAPNGAYKLDVTGNTNVTGDFNATGTITGGTINAKYQDVAEWVESSQSLPAGTVVVLDHTRSNQVVASTKAYDTRVAGVISAQPGITLGESGAAKVLVATTGRVRIKVDATCAPIQVGDLLVTGDREGFAMKSLPVSMGGVELHRPGTLVGKALEPLAKGTGEILVLLSLQ